MHDEMWAILAGTGAGYHVVRARVAKRRAKR